jgi:hypothetical protein
MRNTFHSIIAASLVIAMSPAEALDTGIPSTGLPTASMFSSTLLPEVQGVVSWTTLSQVEPTKQGDKMVPKFSDEVLKLDSRAVRVQGFIMPLDMGDEQHHFLLSAVPPSCPFCMPAGPDSIVEVVAKKTVAYGYEPIIVSGKFAVLKNDPGGVLYRLIEAELVTLPAKQAGGRRQ